MLRDALASASAPQHEVNGWVAVTTVFILRSAAELAKGCVSKDAQPYASSKCPVFTSSSAPSVENGVWLLPTGLRTQVPVE